MEPTRTAEREQTTPQRRPLLPVDPLVRALFWGMVLFSIGVPVVWAIVDLF